MSAFGLNIGLLDSAPAHLDRRPLWTILRRRDVTGRPDAELLSVYRDHGVVPRNSREDNFNKPSDDLSAYRHVRPRDLVLNKMKTWQGSLGVSQYDGIVSPAYFVCELSPGVHARFIHYLLRSDPYVSLYMAASKGIRPGQWDLPFDEFRKLPALLPRLEEQRRIADFLDAENSRIDRLDCLLRDFVATLNVRENALRDGFLDNLVRERGELPFRRFITRIEQGQSPQCEAVVRQNSDEWAVLKLSSVKRGEFYPAEHKRLPEHIPQIGMLEVKSGDFLVTRANTPSLVGDVAVVRVDVRKLLLPDLIYRISLSRNVSADYLAQVALGSRVRSYVESVARGSSQSMVKLRGEDIKSWPVPNATSVQQRDVVHAMRQSEIVSGRLRQLMGRQRELLAERRQALITAAVTGQFEVSSASGRGLTDGVTA